MASLAWTLFVAVVLAVHTESVPLPDTGNLVVKTTETIQSFSPDSARPSADVVSTSRVTENNKPPPPKIYSMHITSDIEFRFAKTLVTSRVANPANESQEVSFSVVLPQDAFITGFVMEIDGKSYRAYVKEKEEAKKTYDDAIRHGQAAAHVAYSARESNSFDVSVNIEPLKKVTFNLTYEELLKRSKGLYHHVVTISPGQVIPDMSVKVHIKEPRNITKLYTPKFSSENKVRDVDDDLCSGDSANSSACTSAKKAHVRRIEDLKVESRQWSREQGLQTSADQNRARFKASLSHGTQGCKLRLIRNDSVLATLYLQTLLGRRDMGESNEIARKKILSPTEAIVEFGPTLEEQKKLSQDKGKGLSGQFEVLYDVQRDPSGGEVLVKDGYFVHFFAPTDLPILPKHIVFVLDVSGSMMGRKIDQVKDAMRTILASLQPDDYFNVIIFSSQVTSWDLSHPEADLVTDRDPYFYSPYFEGTTSTTQAPTPREAVPAYPATQEYIQKALKRINETEANGGTNIFGGLKQAIKTIKQHRELLQKNGDTKARKSIVMFLTDGEANVGESRPDYIISGLSELNTAPQAPIYSLTFGEDGDIDFLTKLSLANSGLARVIYEGADADIQLRRFYVDISSPLLSDVTFTYLPKEVDLDSTTKIHYHTYYQGGELVVAGRTADKEIQAISGDVTAAAKGSEKTQYPIKSLAFEGPQVTLIDYIILPPPQEKVKERPTNSLERAWAYLTVKQLIEEYEAENSKKHKTLDTVPPPLAPIGPPMGDSSTTESPTTVAAPTTTPIPEKAIVATNITEKPSAKQRALELALKYSFVTKLTSLVVVKPNATQATEAKRIVSGDSSGPLGFGGYAAGLSGPPGFPRPATAHFFSPSSAAGGGFPGAGGNQFNKNSPGSGNRGPVLGYSPALSARPSSHYSSLLIAGSGGFAGAGVVRGAVAAGAILGPGAWPSSSSNVRIFGGQPPSPYFRTSGLSGLGFAPAPPSTTFAYAGTAGGVAFSPMYALALPVPPSPPPAAAFYPPGNYGTPGNKPANQKSYHRKSYAYGGGRCSRRCCGYGYNLRQPYRYRYLPHSHRIRFRRPNARGRNKGKNRNKNAAQFLNVFEDIVQQEPLPPGNESAQTTIAPALTEPPADPQPTPNTSENITTIAPGQEEPSVLDPLDKLTLGDVKWLTPEALTNGTVEIDVKGQKKQYNVLSTSDSTTTTNCTAPGISSGKCRHLSQCVLRAVTTSVEAYLPFQCQLENYLAVCCVD